MRLEVYSVQCDRCHGRRYIEGLLCDRCDGNGDITIPEPKSGLSEGAKEVIFAGVAILLAMLIAAAVLQ